MKFKYLARSIDGRVQSGTVESSGQRSAAALIKAQNLILISLDEDRDGFSIDGLMNGLRGVSSNDVVNFTRQLATMISAGLSLSDSLNILKEQITNAQFKTIIQSVQADVSGGNSFSNSLAMYPDIFDTTYISLLTAGEASGNLDDILLRLADKLEKSRSFKSKLKGAMIYPVIVVIAMAGVMTVMVVFVIPKLTDMYASLNIELPLPTQILIGISNIVINYWIFLIIAMVAFVVGFSYFKRSLTGIYTLDKIALKFPIFSNITKLGIYTEFTRTLSLLMRSGVSIVDALQIVANSLGNVYFQEEVYEASRKVEKGIPLSEPIIASKYFPAIIGQMIAVGERTGKMDDVLMKTSAYFESEADQAVKNLSTALEPIIMVLLGLMVGVLILSVITPIYKLTSSF
ncbi:MAG: type II secretion system F family protein [bacterium]|nr:type II secretion system F family protein [bacterium]